MEPRGLPFSRIRLARDQAACIAYAAPTYPAETKVNGIEGTVTLDAIIGKNGEIQALSIQAGHPLLAESALQTVRHWAYRPTKINGIAVEVRTQIEVTFTLPDPN